MTKPYWYKDLLEEKAIARNNNGLFMASFTLGLFLTVMILDFFIGA